MTAELYFLRHGLTNDLHNGRRNRPRTSLVPAGYREMHRAAAWLRWHGIRPDLVVCSQLHRAYQSAAEVADRIGYPLGRIRPTPLLNERYCGSAIGMLNADIKRQYPGGFDDVPGAEKTLSLQSRVGDGARWLMSLPYDTVLAVGHGVYGR